jgi:hypothetical protein
MSRSRSKPPAAGPSEPRIAIDALLDGESSEPDHRFLRRALWLEALDLQLRPYLPPALAAHARLANIDRGRLVYLVDTPAWHARLRLAATEILDAARSLGLEATDLVVKTAVGPHAMQPRNAGLTTAVSVPPLSAAAREAIATALASHDKAASEKDPS